MVRIAICDDNEKQLDVIRGVLENFLSKHSDTECSVVTFNKSFEFLEKLEKAARYDIVLLDICMPGFSGIEVAKTIRRLDETTEIIFLTTSDEFYAEAFSVGALQYLRKPFLQSDFDKAMDKALKIISAPSAKKIQIYGDRSAVHSVEVNKILYIESFRTYRTVHTTQGDYNDTKRSVQAYTEELNSLYPEQFVSPIRGIVINLYNVTEVTPEGARMKDGTIVPVKLDGFRKLRKIFLDYLFRKED